MENKSTDNDVKLLWERLGRLDTRLYEIEKHLSNQDYERKSEEEEM